MTLEGLREKYGNETVLCVACDKLESSTMDIKNIIAAYGYIDLRYSAELNFDEKQVIPYVVIKNGDKIFVTRRIGGDERLVGKLSIGQGGHIDRADIVMDEGFVDVDKTCEKCINRELLEELIISGDVGERDYIHHFCDNSVEVSKVHLCLLYVLDATGCDIEVKETDKLAGEWETVGQLRENYDKLENWSQIALDILFPVKETKKKNVQKKQ